MNKKQLRKELQRIQNVEQVLNVRIDELEKDVDKQEEKNSKQKEKINKQAEEINKQAEEINKQAEEINKQAEEINKQTEEINKQKEEINELKKETKDIRRVQEEQGLDIAALTESLNNLYDKKIMFEDEYATWEDKYNRIIKIIEDNPDLEGVINLGSVQKGMDNAMKSMEFIDEKLDKIYKLALEIENFDEFNYNNMRQ